MWNTSVSRRSFLGSSELGDLIDWLAPFSCLDIGARGGIADEILPLGPAASVHGFEPDRHECDRLNRSLDRDGHQFGKLVFLPTALGPRRERRTLHVMRHEGASSLLVPDPGFTRRFETRSDYFRTARMVDVDTEPLDQVIEDRGLLPPVYMKIDVEGFELEVLKGADRLLRSSLVALRSEVAFRPSRLGQPDFGELAHFLKAYGLLPMGFLYLAQWRSTTNVKHPRKVRGVIPYSRGELVHGDVLFLKDPAQIDAETAAGVKAKLRLACLALLYDYVDFAHDIFAEPPVEAALQSMIGSNGNAALRTASLYLARRYDRGAARRWGRNLAKRILSDTRHMVSRLGALTPRIGGDR